MNVFLLPPYIDNDRKRSDNAPASTLTSTSLSGVLSGVYGLTVGKGTCKTMPFDRRIVEMSSFSADCPFNTGIIAFWARRLRRCQYPLVQRKFPGVKHFICWVIPYLLSAFVSVAAGLFPLYALSERGLLFVYRIFQCIIKIIPTFQFISTESL